MIINGLDGSLKNSVLVLSNSETDEGRSLQ
jgi:hypothetical protein